VVRTVVDTMRAVGVDYLVVVGGPGGEAVRASVGGPPVVWVENAEPDRGLSSSVATGLAALPPNVGAVLMVLGDQPTVSRQVVERVVQAWREGGGPVVAPSYSGLRGNPVLFDSAMFGALGALEGDQGARDLIASDPSLVTMVDVVEPPPMDIDTPSDYDELVRRLPR
jgi:molybdenum cofactor cytidylyltransferase